MKKLKINRVTVILFMLTTIVILLIINFYKITFFLSDCLADSLNNVGKYKEAQMIYEHNLALKQKKSKDKYSIAHSITRLGYFYEQQYKYKEAEALYLKLPMYLDTSKNNFITNVYINNQLARIYFLQRKYKNAEVYLNKNISIWKSQKGNQHAYNYALIELAKLKIKEKEFAEAKALLNKKFGELLYTPKVKTQIGMIGLLNGDYFVISIFYKDQKQFKQAEIYAKEALYSYSDKAWLEKPYATTYYTNLAKIYQLEHKYKDAELLFNKTINIKSKFANDDIFCDYYNLALLKKEIGQDKEYKFWLNKSLLASRKFLGFQNIKKNNVLNNLNMRCNQIRR